jgi:excisionase family DNA binding protein
MPITTTRLINVSEAAEIIGLSRSKVYELLADGLLPSIRIGRTRRIDVADLDAFIDRHRIPTLIPATPDVAAHGALETEDAR